MTNPFHKYREQVARAVYEGRNGHGCQSWALRNKAHKEPYLSDAIAALDGLWSAMQAEGSAVHIPDFVLLDELRAPLKGPVLIIRHGADSMSTYRELTIHPLTKKKEWAWWMDDYFGRHRYGVRFEGEEHVYRPDEIPNALPDGPANA